MSTITPTMPEGPGWMPSSPYRLTLDQYERMVDEGILDTRDRVHLIDGILVAKMTQNDPHCTADDLVGVALQSLLPAGWYIHAAKPIRLPDQNSKPEPDRAVVRGTIRDYSARTPGPADIGLVVEVSDSTLYDDRALVGLYGRAGIPIDWIVNLVHRQVEVYSDPGRDGYGSRQTYTEGAIRPRDHRWAAARPDRRRRHPARASGQDRGQWGLTATRGRSRPDRGTSTGGSDRIGLARCRREVRTTTEAGKSAHPAAHVGDESHRMHDPRELAGVVPKQLDGSLRELLADASDRTDD